jgi:hypothetical protein
MTGVLGEAARLCRRHAVHLAVVACAVVVPVAGAVLALDLADRDAPAVVVARYALGGLAYVLVVVLAWPVLTAGDPRAASGPVAALRRVLAARGPAVRALLAALLAAAVIRLLLSAGAGAALDDAGTLDLALRNAVHAAGKVITAPFLAATLAVTARRSPPPARGGVPTAAR